MSWCTLSRKGKQFTRIRRPKSCFNLLWCMVPKLRRGSIMKRVWNHILIKFSWTISCHIIIMLSILRFSGMCTISNIYPSAHLNIFISRTWLFSKHLLVVVWKDEKPHNTQNKCYLNMWNQSMLSSVCSWIWLFIWSVSIYMVMCFHEESIMVSCWPITKGTIPLLSNSLILFGRIIW